MSPSPRPRRGLSLLSASTLLLALCTGCSLLGVDGDIIMGRQEEQGQGQDSPAEKDRGGPVGGGGRDPGGSLPRQGEEEGEGEGVRASRPGVSGAGRGSRLALFRDTQDPPATAYGSAYSGEELREDAIEEMQQALGQVNPESCHALVHDFVAREMEQARKVRKEVEAGDRTALGRQGRGERGTGAIFRLPAPGPQQMQHLRRLLFFLHVPRTGGRTYHQCFLKALFPVEQRCPRSYDTLRLNLRTPACRLLATHNDFSLMTRLPEQNTSVMTNMRHPVDRILSAYEFAMETAARSLRWVLRRKGESLVEARRRVRSRLHAGAGQRTETRNVWPWSLLLPMLEDDLWERRNSTGVPTAPPGAEKLNSYEKAYLMMPLSEFVEHPSSLDLLHNGATFHVVGITQNSLHKDAPLLRACAIRHPQTAKGPIMGLAKARLDDMLHIGLTEAHKESATLLAAAVGRSLNSLANTGPDLRLLAGHSKGAQANYAARLARLKELHQRNRATLLAHYEKCVDRQRKRYVARRRAGLRMLGPGVNFSHEARGSIAPATLDRIRELNEMDVELLEYARGKFEQERRMFAGRVKAMAAEEEGLRRERTRRRKEGEGGPEEGSGVPGIPAGRRRLLHFSEEGQGALGFLSTGSRPINRTSKANSIVIPKHRDDSGRIEASQGVDCRAPRTGVPQNDSDIDDRPPQKNPLCCPVDAIAE